MVIEENFEEEFPLAEYEKDDIEKVKLKDVEQEGLDSEWLEEVAQECSI